MGLTTPSPLWMLAVSVVALLWPVVGGLECFQCVSTADDGGDCRLSHDGLINATTKELKALSPYRKNCTATNPLFTRCFIEYHLGLGDKYLFYHRGCHDGVTFNDKIKSTPRFDNLNANNETTCGRPTLIANTAVCFSFCQEDMCNGPQPEIDHCLGYNASSPNATLPEGVTCGVDGFYSNIVLISFVVAVFVVQCVWLFP